MGHTLLSFHRRYGIRSTDQECSDADNLQPRLFTTSGHLVGSEEVERRRREIFVHLASSVKEATYQRHAVTQIETVDGSYSTAPRWTGLENREPSAWLKHSHNFSQPGLQIGQVPQSVTDCDTRENRVGKRQPERTCPHEVRPSFQLGRHAPSLTVMCRFQHLRGEINPHNTSVTYDLGAQVPQVAGATAQIEYRVALAEFEPTDHLPLPLPVKTERHQIVDTVVVRCDSREAGADL